MEKVKTLKQAETTINELVKKIEYLQKDMSFACRLDAQQEAELSAHRINNKSEEISVKIFAEILSVRRQFEGLVAQLKRNAEDNDQTHANFARVTGQMIEAILEIKAKLNHKKPAKRKGK